MISLRTGNPANAISTNYTALMSHTNVHDLRTAFLAIIDKGGISKKNADKARKIANETPTLTKLQTYITTFLPRADGLGVDAGSRPTRNN